MTPNELAPLIAVYGAGLEAEVALLRQLRQLAEAQRAATSDHDLDLLTRIADDRDRVLASLVAIEHELKPTRQTLSTWQQLAASIEGYDQVLALHRAAGALVATIISSDQETLQALRDAELARRLAAHAIEVGETTLAAYRRVIAPPLASAGLVNRRG